MAAKLFVGNLSFQATEEDLRELFAQAGTDMRDGLSREASMIRRNEADANADVDIYTDFPDEPGGVNPDSPAAAHARSEATEQAAMVNRTEAGGAAAVGAGLGGVAGLLAGLGALMVPGVGPLLAAGPLAAALGAERCEIFTDVDGVYTADPRIVPGARRIPVILSSEMAEMSWRGAKVMHPRAVELGALHGVEIHVKSSFLEGPGTIITGGNGLEHLETRETVAGIVHDLDVSRITLTGIKTGPGTMSRVFSPLAEAGISVDVIVESAPKRGTSDVAFTVRRGDFSEALRLTGAVADSLDGRVEGEEELGKVSVVGTGMLNRPGYAARMFATLGEAGIPIRLVSTSEIQVTCVLPAGRVEEAVRVLHRDFELEERDV